MDLSLLWLTSSTDSWEALVKTSPVRRTVSPESFCGTTKGVDGFVYQFTPTPCVVPCSCQHYPRPRPRQALRGTDRA